MSTKGPSNHFGNSRGGRQSKKCKDIGYAWARDFNKHRLSYHFNKHGGDFPSFSIADYVSNAIKLANNVDKKRFVSYIKPRCGITYKFERDTECLILIDKRGYVVSCYRLDGGIKRFESMRERDEKKEKKKCKTLKRKDTKQ